MFREIGKRKPRLMAAQWREAPRGNAIDDVASVVGQVGQGIRIDAFRQLAHWASPSLSRCDP